MTAPLTPHARWEATLAPIIEREVKGRSKWTDEQIVGLALVQLAPPQRDLHAATILAYDLVNKARGRKVNGNGRALGGMSDEEGEALDIVAATRLDKVHMPIDMAPVAFYGPLGEYAIELVAKDATEASAPAVLVCSMTIMGAVLGRTVLYRTKGVEFRPSIFGLLVGRSALGKKGTAMEIASEPFREAMGRLDFSQLRIGGVGSGEGLVSSLYRRMDGNTGEAVGLAWEEEYSRLLKAAARDNATVSEWFRSAYDGRLIERETKKERVDFPHLGLVGGITADELLKRSEDIAFVNGFLNRHLIIASQGRRVRGGQEPDALIKSLAGEIGDVMVWLKAIRQSYRPVISMTLGSGAADLFEDLRDRVEGQQQVGGQLGAMAGRGDTIIMRLAVIYAAADRSTQIEEHHLKAAAAIWGYGWSTVRALLGTAPANPFDARLLRWLKGRDEWRSAREIAISMGLATGDRRNLNTALDNLTDSAHIESRPRQGSGRWTVEFRAARSDPSAVQPAPDPGASV